MIRISNIPQRPGGRKPTFSFPRNNNELLLLSTRNLEELRELQVTRIFFNPIDFISLPRYGKFCDLNSLNF